MFWFYQLSKNKKKQQKIFKLKRLQNTILSNQFDNTQKYKFK